MFRIMKSSQSHVTHRARRETVCAPAAVRAYAVALMAGTLFAMSASAQAPAAGATAPATAPHAVTTPTDHSAKNAKPVKHVMSPYARAAGQRERSGQAPVGHTGQTMVQAMGKPHKPHAPPKP